MRKFELLGQSHGFRTTVQICHVTTQMEDIAAAPEEQQVQSKVVVSLERETR